MSEWVRKWEREYLSEICFDICENFDGKSYLFEPHALPHESRKNLLNASGECWCCCFESLFLFSYTLLISLTHSLSHLLFIISGVVFVVCWTICDMPICALNFFLNFSRGLSSLPISFGFFTTFEKFKKKTWTKSVDIFMTLLSARNNSKNPSSETILHCFEFVCCESIWPFNVFLGIHNEVSDIRWLMCADDFNFV